MSHDEILIGLYKWRKQRKEIRKQRSSQPQENFKCLNPTFCYSRRVNDSCLEIRDFPLCDNCQKRHDLYKAQIEASTQAGRFLRLAMAEGKRLEAELAEDQRIMRVYKEE